MEKRVFLITGATGHLGKSTVLQLLKNKERVSALILPNDDKRDFGKYEVGQLDIFVGDITKEDTIEKWFESIEKGIEIYVIHIAAFISLKNKDKRFDSVNYIGTKNVIDAAIRHHVKKFVFVSSVDIIQHRNKTGYIVEKDHYDLKLIKGGYARSKAKATEYVLSKAKEGLIDASISIPSALVGPNDDFKGPINQAIRQYLEGDLRYISKGGYNLVDVRDVASGIISMCFLGRNKEFYLMGGTSISLVNLFKAISNMYQVPPMKRVFPIFVLRLSIPFIAIYSKIKNIPPLINNFSLNCIIDNFNYSNKKSIKELHYEVRSLEETLKDTIEYLLNVRKAIIKR